MDLNDVVYDRDQLLAFVYTSVEVSGFITLRNFLLAVLLLSSEEILLHGMS